MKKSAVVLYTTLAVGHLAPMIELGNLIAARCSSLAIHLILASPPVPASSGVPSVSSAAPHFTFHFLPVPYLPPDFSTTYPLMEALILESLRLSNPDLRLSLESISGTHSVHVLVMDIFCARSGPIARDLGIPYYLFYPSGGGMLAMFLHFPILHDSWADDNGSEQDNDKSLHVPGLPPILFTDLPKALQYQNNTVSQFFRESSLEASSSEGIILNTFKALEHRAVEAITRGECRPEDQIPIFCIGPLISSDKRVGRAHECLTWLDGQPKGGVVFLCFGSMGLFPEEQLQDIAMGLEMSGQRFLWVVHRPSEAPGKATADVRSGPDQGVASLLPKGFLDRTEGRGMVVSSWAPQMDVLRHESVGGFMTHCGWNSVLEAVSAGVPMVAWPLYAEQRINRLVMVEEIGIALRLEEDKGDGSVSVEEVGKKVRMLMEGEEGAAVRSRTRAMKDAAAAAVDEGGSSRAALEQLLESLKL